MTHPLCWVTTALIDAQKIVEEGAPLSAGVQSMRSAGISSETEFRWARMNIEGAERYLSAGNASPRIPGELSGAIMHATYGWLKARGIAAGSNYMDASAAFERSAGENLLRLRSEYTRRWMMLEYRLIGDPDNIVSAMPPEQWLPLARDAAAEARALVQAIEADARPEPDNPPAAA